MQTDRQTDRTDRQRKKEGGGGGGEGVRNANIERRQKRWKQEMS